MNCLTSSTVKKCRATSSIAPRQAKRGWSVICPAGTVHAPPPDACLLGLDRRRQELAKGLDAVEETGRRRGDDAHGVGRDRELVAFAAERRPGRRVAARSSR